MWLKLVMWWHETCFFFCFSHRSRTVFLGMPIRVCLHLSKIIFKAQWGWRIIYCFKKRLKKITNLVDASPNLTFVLIYYFLGVIHCAVGSNFMQLHLYWFFWLNKCTIGGNNVWIIRTTFGHLHNQKIHKYTLRIQGFSMR